MSRGLVLGKRIFVGRVKKKTPATIFELSVHHYTLTMDFSSLETHR
jgi:hypothetical protein